MAKPLCIYHASCNDGFTAAWAVWLALDKECDFRAAVHGQQPPVVAGRDVIIVDFSYPRLTLQEMTRSARSILVLDHHKTAAEDLAGLPVAPENYETWCKQVEIGDGPTIAALFDMDRSGAGIAWDFFHDRHRPALVDYVEDRDLWRWQLPESREINAVVSTANPNFGAWQILASDIGSRRTLVVERGVAILQRQEKDVAEIASTARRMKIGGYEVRVANAPFMLASEVGNRLAPGQPFAATYMDMPNGRHFSLRSAEDGIDVSKIAENYGGGGHAHAAGFKTDLGWEGDEQ